MRQACALTGLSLSVFSHKPMKHTRQLNTASVELVRRVNGRQTVLRLKESGCGSTPPGHQYEQEGFTAHNECNGLVTACQEEGKGIRML